MRGLKSETPSVGEIREEVRQSSRSKFGRERAEIEKEMAAQMEAMVESPPPGANEPLKNS